MITAGAIAKGYATKLIQDDLISKNYTSGFLNSGSSSISHLSKPNYIKKNYSNKDSICLLCSEALPNQCHRRLVAEIFGEVFEDVQIIHL